MPEENCRLIEQVQRLLEKLGPAGWAELLLAHGLDIGARDLRSELLRPLSQIDRSLPGFEDFALEGFRGIEPGIPAKSLLYHAIASPRVTTALDGKSLSCFPTYDEIDAVENLVYGINPPSISELRVNADDAPLAIVVFAYEYRIAIDSVHQKHADMCFSRTGISRIGTEKPNYKAATRGFTSLSDSDARSVCVIPSKYSAFLAASFTGDQTSFGPMRSREAGENVIGSGKDIGVVPSTKSDTSRKFWVPIHKLFSGPECLRGYDLNVSLKARHLNEKIRRVHLAFLGQGHETGWSEPALSEPPFIFAGGIAELCGPPLRRNLLVPVDHPALVEPARYRGKLLTFKVPKDTKVYASSLNIPRKESGARAAPEYVHARVMIDQEGRETNLNDLPDIVDLVKKGGYDALHFVDYTGDGWIEAECQELALEVPRRLPAYSIIAPPDFFPFVKQQELMDWWNQSCPPDLYATIWPTNPGPPKPLSDERYPGNLSLSGANFDPTDDTISAIVSSRFSAKDKPAQIDRALILRVSFLPDRAAGVFAPGWDCSIDRTEESDRDDDGNVVLPGITFLSAHGLGSPFPEDAKLCAALSSFWPAAAPDITRVFEPGRYATATPLPDDLTGDDGDPWDGIWGPRISTRNPNEVEYSSINYGDYVLTALRNGFDIRRISRVSPTDYVVRTLVMARVYEALGASTVEDKRRWSLFSFTNAKPESEELQEAERQTGRCLNRKYGFRFLLFQHNISRVDPDNFKKVLVSFDQMQTAYADPQLVLLNDAASHWQKYDF